jgi:hypothetical protein
MHLRFILTVTVLVLGGLMSLFFATHLIFLLFISRPNLLISYRKIQSAVRVLIDSGSYQNYMRRGLRKISKPTVERRKLCRG